MLMKELSIDYNRDFKEDSGIVDFVLISELARMDFTCDLHMVLWLLGFSVF